MFQKAVRRRPQSFSRLALSGSLIICAPFSPNGLTEFYLILFPVGGHSNRTLGMRIAIMAYRLGRRPWWWLICTATLAWTHAIAQDNALPVAPADQLVENFQKLIVLHESAAGTMSHESAVGGQYLFFHNRILALQLVDAAVAAPEVCKALIGRLQTDGRWHQIDKLALGGVLSELSLRLEPDADCLAGVEKERQVLATVRNRYNLELTAALSVPRNNLSRLARAEWSNYLASLNQRFDAQALAKDLERHSKDIPSAVSNARTVIVARAGERDEWTDGSLPPKTVLLTFDDGPHPVYTRRILDILARYRIKAVFFQIGHNLGIVRPSGEVLIREPDLVRRMLAEGHSLANHSYTHPLLPRLDEIRLDDEIDRTERILASVAGAQSGATRLFRPPYGARSDLVLAEITARGLRSVLWNIDSRDWADPIPRSIAQRVLEEASREGRGIILFHDIHGRTVDALPRVIEELLQHGFKFAHFRDAKLIVDQE
jgi:peptidoglycan/xylan/chitin deacetylase (PgdA/CDA1 family)